jgi:hypothetical protein
MSNEKAIEALKHAILMLGSLKIEAAESGRIVQIFNALNFSLKDLEGAKSEKSEALTEKVDA